MPDRVTSVLLEPDDTTLEPGDWLAADERRHLLRSLRAQELDVHEQPRPPGAGEKGTASDIILALGGSGTVAAATKVLLTWLNARSTRRVTVTVGRTSVRLVGEGMSEGSMRAALLAVLGRPPGAAAAEAAPDDSEAAAD